MRTIAALVCQNLMLALAAPSLTQIYKLSNKEKVAMQVVQTEQLKFKFKK